MPLGIVKQAYVDDHSGRRASGSQFKVQRFMFNVFRAFLNRTRAIPNFEP